MKVRILKHCKIHGAPVAPGEVHDVHDERAKALTDNGYAEWETKSTHGSESYAEMQARVEREGKMRDSEDLTGPVEAVKDLQADPEADPESAE